MGKKRNVIIDASQDDNLEGLIPDNNQELKDKPETDIKAKKSIKKSQKARSEKYLDLKTKIDQAIKYKPQDAIKTILSISKEKFDASIELHLEVKSDKLSGSVQLPHSTGKTKKVVIYNDQIEPDIKSQKIDFDVLLASPKDMPKLAKYAKFLGPKGLMPNPKNGTLTNNPESALKNFSGNNLSFKTEKKAPLIHLTIGKRSLGQEKLTENLNTIIRAVNSKQIKKAYISSTMSPSINLDLS